MKKLLILCFVLFIPAPAWLQTPGTLKWTFKTGARVVSSPAIRSDGTIYVGSEDKNLYAINPDGTKRWELHISRSTMCAPALGKDGTFYIGSEDFNLKAIYTDSYGLACSSWPIFQHDERHTGNASGEICIPIDVHCTFVIFIALSVELHANQSSIPISAYKTNPEMTIRNMRIIFQAR